MAKLSDMLEQDLAAIINVDEHATRHIIEGEEVDVVLDNDQLAELSDKLGLAKASILFYAPSSKLPKGKTRGSLLNYDGQDYTVEYWTTSAGMATVALYKPESM